MALNESASNQKPQKYRINYFHCKQCPAPFSRENVIKTVEIITNRILFGVTMFGIILILNLNCIGLLQKGADSHK